jgi:hypothetical protein
VRTGRQREPEGLDPFAVITIRAGSVGLLQRMPQLGINAPHMRPLPPLSPSAYRDVITRPAAVYARRVTRLDIEPELVEVLVAKAQGAYALPLLAFTLQRMFDLYHIALVSPAFFVRPSRTFPPRACWPTVREFLHRATAVMSNFYCHPGRAGGLPPTLGNGGTLVPTKRSGGIHRFQQFADRQTRRKCLGDCRTRVEGLADWQPGNMRAAQRQRRCDCVASGVDAVSAQRRRSSIVAGETVAHAHRLVSAAKGGQRISGHPSGVFRPRVLWTVSRLMCRNCGLRDRQSLSGARCVN